jgi:LmbE family N-acetylglucosaminyl deacetylase
VDESWLATPDKVNEKLTAFGSSRLTDYPAVMQPSSPHSSPYADILVPDGRPLDQALQRSSHLCIGAHPDDVEILGWHGINQCFNSDQEWFSGVVVTDGAGSPRSGAYADFSDEKMIATRRQEQREAAALGGYSAQLQLGYSSTAVRRGDGERLVAQLQEILQLSQPRVLYLHNLADAHATHVAVATASLAAVRNLPPQQRPEQVLGVEIWRSLDWLPAAYRVELPLPEKHELQLQLLRAHASQVAGGKAYDRATIARQIANATFASSHSLDAHSACCLAMDYSALLTTPALTNQEFLQQCLQAFARELSVHD